jgi:uncharacterized OsmC-like protein
MAHLDEYLSRKGAAMTEKRAAWADARGQGDASAGVVRISASSALAGNTGVRPTMAGEHRIISDSAPGLAGNALGPTAPEMLLAALASCLVHTYVIQAVLLDVPLDEVRVEVSGALDMLGVIAGEGPAPVIDHLRYTPHIASPASAEALDWLHAAVDANCPVLNTLRLAREVVRAQD